MRNNIISRDRQNVFGSNQKRDVVVGDVLRLALPPARHLSATSPSARDERLMTAVAARPAMAITARQSGSGLSYWLGGSAHAGGCGLCRSVGTL